jgi:hypothetical protein
VPFVVVNLADRVGTRGKIFLTVSADGRAGGLAGRLGGVPRPVARKIGTRMLNISLELRVGRNSSSDPVI